MPQSTIFESYKYAVLATAAYVRMGARSLDGASFAREAALESQGGGRLPLSQATALFNPADTNAPRWNVMHYYGGDVPSSLDPIAARDISGFEATLFERNGEKVLALRGTEPNADALLPTLGGVLPLGRDLLSADLGQIGILGLVI